MGARPAGCPPPPPPLARPALAQARDEFYACVEKSGERFAPEGPVPPACRQARAAFQRACAASWVRHFDQQHDKELKLLQALQSNIRKQGPGTLGSLAGEAQR